MYPQKGRAMQTCLVFSTEACSEKRGKKKFWSCSAPYCDFAVMKFRFRATAMAKMPFSWGFSSTATGYSSSLCQHNHYDCYAAYNTHWN